MARSKRAENLDTYATGLANEPEEEKEEEYATGNRKQLARNPVGGNQGLDNKNEPTLDPSMLGIHGRLTGRFSKRVTTFPEEVDKQNTGTKARALHRVLMGETLF